MNDLWVNRDPAVKPPELPKLKPSINLGVQPYITFQPFNLPISLIYSVEPSYPFKTTTQHLGCAFQPNLLYGSANVSRTIRKSKDFKANPAQVSASILPRLDVTLWNDQLGIRTQTPIIRFRGKGDEVIFTQNVFIRRELEQERKFYQGVNPDYITQARAGLGTPPKSAALNLFFLSVALSSIIFVVRSFFTKPDKFDISKIPLTFGKPTFMYRDIQQLEQDRKVLRRVLIQKLRKRPRRRPGG